MTGKSDFVARRFWPICLPLPSSHWSPPVLWVALRTVWSVPAASFRISCRGSGESPMDSEAELQPTRAAAGGVAGRPPSNPCMIEAASRR